MDELVVFLMREFHWTYEYTKDLIKKLPIKKLNALMGEVKYQKVLEDYQTAANFAMIIANWASAQTKGRRYKITDFIGQPPGRNGKGGESKETGLYDAAKKEGIIMPKGE